MQLVGLGDSASNYLASFAAELAIVFDDPTLIPDTQYVAAGEIPWDGEALVISLGSIEQGVPGRPMGTSLFAPSAAISFTKLYVELIRRCSIIGVEGGLINTPSANNLNNEGIQAMNDAGAMVQTAINLKAQDIPVEWGVDYAIGSCMPLGPEGGLVGVRLEIDISLDGSAN